MSNFVWELCGTEKTKEEEEAGLVEARNLLDRVYDYDDIYIIDHECVCHNVCWDCVCVCVLSIVWHADQ